MSNLTDRLMEWLMRPCPLLPAQTRWDTILMGAVVLGAATIVVVALARPASAQVPFAVPESTEPRVIRHVYPPPPYAVAPAQPISPYRAEQFRSHGPVIPLEPNMSPYRREQLGLRSDPATASPYRQELWRSGRR